MLLFDIAKIIWYTPRLARKVQALAGVPVAQQWQAQFGLLARGIDPMVYFLHELYRPGALARADDYFLNREVKGALLRHLHRLVPPAAFRRINLGDKLQFTAWCARSGLPHVAPLMLIEDGHVVWQAGELLDLDQDLFVKPRTGRGAKGAALFRATGSFRYQDEKGRHFRLGTIVSALVRRFGKTDLMVLPRLLNHPELADLARRSLITLRVVTCLDEDMEPEMMFAYLRLLTKLERVGHPDEPTFEYAAAVDSGSGTLSRMIGDQPECLSQRLDLNPLTEVPVTGRSVPFWHEALALAVRAHRVARDRLLVGWDIAITPSGPVLLEGNSYPDMHFPQRILDRPIGKMRMGQLLRHHMTRLEPKLREGKRMV